MNLDDATEYNYVSHSTFAVNHVILSFDTYSVTIPSTHDKIDVFGVEVSGKCNILARSIDPSLLDASSYWHLIPNKAVIWVRHDLLPEVVTGNNAQLIVMALSQNVVFKLLVGINI